MRQNNAVHRTVQKPFCDVPLDSCWCASGTQHKIIGMTSQAETFVGDNQSLNGNEWPFVTHLWQHLVSAQFFSVNWTFLSPTFVNGRQKLCNHDQSSPMRGQSWRPIVTDEMIPTFWTSDLGCDIIIC